MANAHPSFEASQKDSMRVTVVGAGAMGALFGARFFAAGAAVELLDVDEEHVKAIRRSGLKIQELDGSIQKFPIPARSAPVPPERPSDLILVMVKSTATESAMDLVHPDSLGEETLVLSLQNGLGNGEVLARLVGGRKVLVGVTGQGATREGPGFIRHGGEGPTLFGGFSGERPSGVDRVLTLFHRSGLEAAYSEDIHRVIWRKLLVNVGINAITALCSISNGRIADLEPARQLSAAAVQEALAVAEAEGIALPSNIFEQVLDVARRTAPNRSSMRQDLEARRPTEIDTINGAVVRLGQRHRIPTPVNWALVQLVRIKEQTYGE